MTAAYPTAVGGWRIVRAATSLANFDYPYTHLVDIELLTPARLVRYLGRPLSRDALARLAEAWMQAARDEHPEQTVPTVQDDAAGLAVVVNQSTPFAVTLEILVEANLGGDVPDRDGVSFDVARSGLIDAAHAIEGWLAGATSGPSSNSTMAHVSRGLAFDHSHASFRTETERFTSTW